MAHKQQANETQTAAEQAARRPARKPKYLQNGWMNEVAAADYIGRSVSRLQNRRSASLPPDYVKVGRSVYYKPEDLDAYLLSKK